MKSKKHILFLIKLACLGLIMTGLTVLVKQFIPQWITPLWVFQILFFSIVCIIVYFSTMKIKEKNMHKFTNFYMATVVVKLLLYLTIILIYALNFPEDKKPFVITFLAYYLCFSVFETYILVKEKK